jgi:hypothetical protein
VVDGATAPVALPADAEVDVGIERILTDAAARRAFLDGGTRLVQDELNRKSGLGGMALRAGFRTLQAVRPDIVPAALDALLPAFADAVRGEVEAALAGEGLITRFRDRAGPIADAMLTVTDARAARAANRTVAGAYQALRGTARNHVVEAVPGVGRLLASLFERFPG